MTTSHNPNNHNQHDLPEEITVLYREQIIEQRDIAPMTQLRDELIQSAPQPRDDFQQQLSQRLESELRQPKRSIIYILTPKRLTATRVALLAALLVIGVGTVLAVSTLIRQFTDFDAGLKAVFEQGRGHEIYGVSQTIEDFTVSVEWAYADGNRLIVAFMIRGKPGEQYTNLGSHVHLLRLQADGTDIPGQQGMTAMLDSNGEMIISDDPTVTADRSLSIFTYDLSGIQDRGLSSLDLQLEVKVAALTLQQRTQTPLEDLTWTEITPAEHFFLNFSVPLVNDQRVFNSPMTATDQNVTITLKQVTVAPSQTRVVICFTPPDPARQWTAIPRLITANGEVPGGGGVNNYMDGELACDEYSYQAGMYDYTGEWQLEITELVGFGSGGGNDQQRIAGSWKFAFTVP
jgi:hypothetical protein